MEYEILAPNGYSLGTASSEFSYDQLWSAQETGTHTLIVRDGGRGFDGGQFDVRIP